MSIYHIEVDNDNTAQAVEHEMQVYNLAPNAEVSVSKSFGQGPAFVVVQTAEPFDASRIQTPIRGVRMYTPEETPTVDTQATEPQPAQEKPLDDEPASTNEPVQ